jgi:hypothetical protein
MHFKKIFPIFKKKRELLANGYYLKKKKES